MKKHNRIFRLIRIYGGTEPTLFSKKAVGNAAFKRLVVKHLKAEPYDYEDGLFCLATDGKVQSVTAFTAYEMEELRRRAGEKL